MSIVAKKTWLTALPLLTVVMLVKAAQPQATTTMSELMTRIIQPSSDAVFYVSRVPPENDMAWRELENKTLMLAESANLLLIPGYSRDSEQWLRDAILMRDASVRAVAAARARDMETLVELNNDLYESCESCHEATR
jgi:cation diffusion facilitator CzcD-associated flavoprotein CzcO